MRLWFLLTFKSSNTEYASLSMATLRFFPLVFMYCSRSLSKYGFYFYSFIFFCRFTPCQRNDALFLETQPILQRYLTFEIYKAINIHHLMLRKTENKILKFVSSHIDDNQLAYILLFQTSAFFCPLMVREKDRNMQHYCYKK